MGMSKHTYVLPPEIVFLYRLRTLSMWGEIVFLYRLRTVSIWGEIVVLYRLHTLSIWGEIVVLYRLRTLSIWGEMVVLYRLRTLHLGRNFSYKSFMTPGGSAGRDQHPYLFFLLLSHFHANKRKRKIKYYQYWIISAPRLKHFPNYSSDSFSLNVCMIELS